MFSTFYGLPLISNEITLLKILVKLIYPKTALLLFNLPNNFYSGFTCMVFFLTTGLPSCRIRRRIFTRRKMSSKRKLFSDNTGACLYLTSLSQLVSCITEISQNTFHYIESKSSNASANNFSHVYAVFLK